ncbi:hypothetical protein [Methyloceanibacter stevinii]|uniref:hypothetical protein n=1 Tax=Methyloceanibacter stevinii TaxID=1774970 RepID=UPI0026CE491D
MRQVVDEGLGQIVALVTLAEMQDPDGAGEQAEHAHDGQRRKDREHEGLGDFAAEHGQTDGGDGKRQRQQHHERNTAVAAGPVRHGFSVAHRRIDIRHGMRKYPIRLGLTGDCHEGPVPIRAQGMN